MTDEIDHRRIPEQSRSAVASSQEALAGGTRRRAGGATPKFNRYLYENLNCHFEGQIERWSREAVREPDPVAARALWFKAEGLGYALRLLHAFRPEFRDLIDSASGSAAKQAGRRRRRAASNSKSKLSLASCSEAYQTPPDTHRPRTCWIITTYPLSTAG